MRFKPRDDIENSGISASNTDSCVKVTSEGMYKVESQITFKVNAEFPQRVAYHAIILKEGSELKERMQVKRSLFVDKQNIHGRETIHEASNINVLSYIKANDQICVRVNPVQNLYNSRIDNILDIEKRFDIATQGNT